MLKMQPKPKANWVEGADPQVAMKLTLIRLFGLSERIANLFMAQVFWPLIPLWNAVFLYAQNILSFIVNIGILVMHTVSSIYFACRGKYIKVN
jgi:hypothetical protein